MSADDPSAWFEHRYAAGVAGARPMPWDPSGPRRLLTDWTTSAGLDGSGLRAVVVGCGLGQDAEHLASLGYEVFAFDVAPSAIAEVRRRRPSSPVHYVVADVLDLPEEWSGVFDLVVDVQTIQSLPRSSRADVTAAMARCVGPGGLLLAVAAVDVGVDDGLEPPWPVTRDELDLFVEHGLTEVVVQSGADPDDPTTQRFRGVWVRLG